MDPMIAGLLEGAAFLAARVQLKLKHEFPEFTDNLLEQLVPNYLAPTPSALLAKVVPPFGDPALREGSRIARGSYLDATYRERDRRVACRYRLSSRRHAVAVRPRSARNISPPRRRCRRSALPVGPNVARRAAALAHATAPPPRSRTSRRTREAAKKPDAWFAGCRIKRAADLSPRHRGGRRRALRAALRPLRRRLLPLSR